MQFQWKVSFSPGDSILITQHHPQDEGHKWFQIAPFKWYLTRDTLVLRVHALGLPAQIQLFYFWSYRLWHMSVAAPCSCSCCPPVLGRSAHASKASAMQQRRNIHWQWPGWNSGFITQPERQELLLWWKSTFRLFQIQPPLHFAKASSSWISVFSNHMDLISHWLYPSKLTLTGVRVTNRFCRYRAKFTGSCQLCKSWARKKLNCGQENIFICTN